jgi:hypothetical protein
MSGSRPLASLLLRHASWMMPESRRRWGDGMARELQYIPDDRQALTWAIGCVLAAYADRIRSEGFLLPWLARLLLSVWCFQFALLYFRHPDIQPGACALSASLCAYQPTALQALLAIAACCYLIAGVRLAFNRRTAALPYGIAVLICFITFGYAAPLSHPEAIVSLGLLSGSEIAIGDFRLALSSFALRLWLGVILPLIFGLVIWLVDQYSESESTTRRLI